MSVRDRLWRRPRKRFATGGIVNVEQAPMLTAGCSGAGYLIPTSAPVPSEAQPIAIIEFNGVMTNEREQQFRDQTKVSARTLAPNSAAKSCTCDLVIYSEHRCGWRTGTGA